VRFHRRDARPIATAVEGPDDSPPFAEAPDAGPFETGVRCFGFAEWIRVTRWKCEDLAATADLEQWEEVRVRIDRSPFASAWPVSLTAGSVPEAVAGIEAFQGIGPVAPPAADTPVFLMGDAAAQVLARLGATTLAAGDREVPGTGLLFAALAPVADDQGDGLIAFRGIPAVMEAGRPVGHLDSEWLLLGRADGVAATPEPLTGSWWSLQTALRARGLSSMPM
jgi:hypothetical protein